MFLSRIYLETETSVIEVCLGIACYCNYDLFLFLAFMCTQSLEKIESWKYATVNFIP
jgi:hypothetical protein